LTVASKKAIHALPLVKIRTEALDWRLSQLPFSIRLARALRRLGFERLGELDGLNLQRLLSQRNCGRATVLELVKVLSLVESGDFDLAADPDRPDGLRHLVRHIDSVLETLPARMLQILLMRLGGTRRGKPSTLQEIGNRFNLTRERARQIFSEAIGRVLKSCGPRGILLLHNLSERCLESVCPLTAELLNSFLGPAPSHRYALPFYLRLFKELDPRIPAWPDGQESGHSFKGRQKEVTRLIARCLENRTRLSLKAAFEALKSEFDEELPANELLEILRRCPALQVEFPEAGCPASLNPPIEKESAGLPECSLTRHPSKKAKDLNQMAALIDAVVDQLSTVDRENLVRELGAGDLFENERDRRPDSRGESSSRSLDSAIGRFRGLGGEALSRLLNELTQRCQRRVCPLTPEVFQSWCCSQILYSSYTPSFYLRLLSRLEPALPAWPDGQQPSSEVSNRSAAIAARVEEIICATRRTLQLRNVFARVKSGRGLSGITVKEFLTALQQHPLCQLRWPFPAAIDNKRASGRVIHGLALHLARG